MARPTSPNPAQPGPSPDLVLFGALDPQGGIGRSVGKLARYAVAAGYHVETVTYGPGKPVVEPSQRLANLTHHHLGPDRCKLALTWRLARYLQRRKPTTLLSTTDRDNRIALLARSWPGARRSRCYVSLWNHVSSAAARPAVRRRKFRRMRRLYPRADCIIADCRGIADDLIENGLPADRIETIYAPIIDADLHARADEPVDHPWFQPGQPPVVLGVGRLAPQKDFPTLLRAFARVGRQQNARLVILGEGPERSRLENLARELEITQSLDMPGFVDNPHPYMARAGLFALSSAWEGVSLVLIEAIALGTPVVATDCPSGPGEVLTGSLRDRLISVGDVDALATAMDRELRGRSVDPAALDRAVEPFRVQIAANRYLRVMGLATGKTTSLRTPASADPPRQPQPEHPHA
jgi:glycosyltransferase involved in cell wall biosynthesis